jgi:hypothetical protein
LKEYFRKCVFISKLNISGTTAYILCYLIKRKLHRHENLGLVFKKKRYILDINKQKRFLEANTLRISRQMFPTPIFRCAGLSLFGSLLT